MDDNPHCYRGTQFDYSSPPCSGYGHTYDDHKESDNVPPVDNDGGNGEEDGGNYHHEEDIIVGEGSELQSPINTSVNIPASNDNTGNRALQRLLQQLPEDIRGVFEHCSQFSNTSFLFAMAYCFASNITELGSYFRVKLSLMLSLVQLNEDLKNHCSLLVLCDDDLAVGRLFSWAKQFAPKSFYYSSTLYTLAGVTSSVFEPETSTSGGWTSKRCVPVYEFAQSQMFQQQSQAAAVQQPYAGHRLLVSGTLHLAAGGVHIFSTAAHLEALKSKERASLEHVLESNEIIPKELLANVDDITDSKLKSIIWANIPATSTSNSDQKSKSRWLDLFGSVVQVKSPGLHLPNSSEAQIPAASWAAYFELCNRLPGQMIFSGPAESLIHRYYLYTRQYLNETETIDPFYQASLTSTSSFASHQNSVAPTTASTNSTISNRGHFKPKKCLSLLHLLAGSVAKLNLRTEVLKEDALLAVLLFESQLRDTAEANLTEKNSNDFSLHQAAARLPLADLDHIIEEEVETEKNQRSVTMRAGSSSSGRGRRPKLNLSGLLHNTYMASFERTLMDLLADPYTTHISHCK